MKTVELVYDRACPHVAAARRHLLAAFSRAGLRPLWTEWDRDGPDSPTRVRGLASPTILVDGRDIASAPAPSIACRIYPASSGRLSGSPPVYLIAAALKDGGRERCRPTGIAAATPAFGLALLPKVTCPLCWPAYSAALSAVGIGFFDYTPYVLPLMIASVAFLLGLLAWRGWRTGGRVPLAIGLAGAALMLGGKFALESDPLAYAGGAGFVLAALWPQRRGAALCPNCVTVSPEEKTR